MDFKKKKNSDQNGVHILSGTAGCYEMYQTHSIAPNDILTTNVYRKKNHLATVAIKKVHTHSNVKHICIRKLRPFVTTCKNHISTWSRNTDELS